MVRQRTVVIGLGSPLMGDDGIGLRALERLRETWDIEGVDLIDGGTWGMSLLPAIEDASHVMLLDAIRANAIPGEIIKLERQAVPRYLSAKVSPHQVDLCDVLAVAELRGRLPDELVALGIEPRRVSLGTELSEECEEALDVLVAAAVDRLMRWGHDCEPRLIREAAPAGTA
jgi:hydrogenase maturation protease